MAHVFADLSFSNALGRSVTLKFGPGQHAFDVQAITVNVARSNLTVGMRRNVDAGVEANEAALYAQTDVLWLCTFSSASAAAPTRHQDTFPRGLLLLSGHVALLSQGSASGTANVRIDLYGDYKRLSLAEWAALTRRTSSES